jgi:hypothetical protein
MGKLQNFYDETDPLRRNRLLFDWLRDDEQRRGLYDELRQAGFPGLRFRSVLRSANWAGWPDQDVYLLSGNNDIEAALRHYSVEPYRALDSRFMLGIDDPAVHDPQNSRAVKALDFTPQEIADCASAAFDRAAVLPLQQYYGFNLPVELAEQAAIHFVELLFGFRDEAHLYLQFAAEFAYTRLCFQIVGRHFVADSGLAPENSPDAEKLKSDLRKQIREAAAGTHARRSGEPARPVIRRLLDDYRDPRNEELIAVVLGLMAGTVGNIAAAVSIAINHFFTRAGKNADTLMIDDARKAAREDIPGLETMIKQALVRNPAAAFLARTSVQWPCPGSSPTFRNENGQNQPIPKGAHVLLAMGADANPDLVFGGPPVTAFPHNCIGRRLAWPLILEVVRQVLLLPGLSRRIDPISCEPAELKKRWGVICECYCLQYQRDRRLNQQPLFVVLPIKEPVAENAEKLRELTVAGAHIVEAALRKSKFVHFAYFMLVENQTHLAMLTVYDGDFDAYIEHFALQVPLFDKQFEYLDVVQPTPIRDYPKQFVENIKKYNRTPLANYFFSAYPTTSVADVDNATGGVP